jgi:molecular chaperone DnaJ
MAKNFYLILGVGRGATLEEIRAAFRRRSKELHPDTSGLGSEPFLALQEAYLVLSDPKRRSEYDRAHPNVSTGSPLRSPAASVPLRATVDLTLRPGRSRRARHDVALTESFDRFLPSFDEIADRLWRNFSTTGRPKDERAESLTIEMVCTPAEAALGGAIRLAIPGRATCPACHGYGHTDGFACWRCGGRGAVAAEHPVDVVYPAGMRCGHMVQVPLTALGIENLFLTVVFRISSAA